ncbi:MAG: hypothetical protein O3B74_12675 [Proteobacteria bacterium]|nr:hypothetical protein [Pseudomonadota bacterium]
MIRLTDTIGQTQGNPEDIAPIQVLLARAKYRIRPFWRGEIDGRMTPALRTAIEMFQYEAGILAPPLMEDPGWIHPDGPTITALKAAAPAALSRIRVLPGTAQVFMTQRSSLALRAELARLEQSDLALSPVMQADLLTMIENCHARLGLQLRVIDNRVVSGIPEPRLGVKGLSLPLPGGVFHTVPVSNPWMIPEEFWAVVQVLAPQTWVFQPTAIRGRGWLSPSIRCRDAA